MSGCAFGTTRVNVAHSPLPPPTQKRAGIILIRKFVDARESDRVGTRIGTKRNGFGAPTGHIGIANGTLEELLTKYFAEALTSAGYTVKRGDRSSSGASFSAILDGEIKVFWLDLAIATWHNVDVLVKLKDKNGASVLWQRNIDGGETNVLWLGVKSEFENVIRQALDKALRKAVQEFSSDEFNRKVAR